MALSMKNTLLSLSLSGALLFTGFLSGEMPIESGKTGLETPVAQADLPGPGKVDTRQRLQNAKHSFAAPYFSFGKSGFAQGVKQ